MRNALSELLREELLREELGRERGPAHAGLAYERWAPSKPGGGEAGKEEQREWNRWLEWLEKSREPEGYEVAFRRWREELRQSPTVCFQAKAASRLLVGHGNAAPTGVGLTLHHTWGVPVLPGSALKGLVAGYVRALLGPDSDAELPERVRADFQGVRWKDGRMVAGPGETYRRLFGAPDVEGEEQGASPGEIIFHDALWVARKGERPEMLARDVLTVHQKTWYGGQGWPSDYDAPNPVAFLTVRPGACFLVALSLAPGAGPEGAELLKWAAERLREALSHWGLGGKTAAGYGRLEPEGPLEEHRGQALVRRSATLDEFLAWFAGQWKAVTQGELLDGLESQWMERLVALPSAEREECQRALRSLNVRKQKLAVRMSELLTRLGEGG